MGPNIYKITFFNKVQSQREGKSLAVGISLGSECVLLLYAREML